MLKIFKSAVFIVCLIAVLVLPSIVFAQGLKNAFTGDSPLNAVATSGGFEPATKTSIATIAGTVVNVFLSILGIIFIILIIYAGYSWMTAEGDETKVTKAKDTLRRAIIGLIIILSAYAIYLFLWNNFFMAPNSQ